MKITKPLFLTILISALLFLGCEQKPESDTDKLFHAFCIDFNWGNGGPNHFAEPGLWKSANPKEHVQWYKDMGVNIIQTFCVSCNGYAWYKNGIVPEQPGLEHDFLPEMVRLGHNEGMKVLGYFCIGANTKWGIENPELSYAYPNKYHIPFTKEYLKYLDRAIRDAVTKTGIDGFMIDWLWQPERISTDGKWLACEKQLYQEIMGEQFPGEDILTKEKYNTYSRKAINNCWNVIRKAAKESNPDCIVWLSCHSPTHEHVVNSQMFTEVDWFMNEGGDMERLDSIKNMVGTNTRLITCMANWNGVDAQKVVPQAVEANIGLYGFTRPEENSLVPPVDNYLYMPIDSFRNLRDGINIATLARVYKGHSYDFVQKTK